MTEGEPRLIATHQNVLHTKMGSQRAQTAHVEQGLRLRRQGAKPLSQLRAELINVAGRRRPRQSALEVQLGLIVRDERVRQVGRLVEDHIRRLGGLATALPAHRRHRFLEPAHVEVEADRVGMARLL